MIYPNREELNAAQEKQQSRRSLPIPRRKRKPETPSTDGDSPEAKRPKLDESAPQTVTPPPNDQDSQQENEQVELQIRPHPNDPLLVEETIRTLVTTKICTVAHLIKFLSISSHLDPDISKKSAVRALNFDEKEDGPVDRKYTLYVQMGTSDEYVVLPSSSTLKQITDTYWTGDKLKLYVSISDSLSSAAS